MEKQFFITFPRNKLYWKPSIWTNQSIDSGRSKSFRVNFTPYVKKNYREGGFIWNVQETSKIQRETHSRDKTKQCDVSRKKTLRPSSFCEGTFSLIIFPRNKNSFGSLVLNQRVNWFGKIQVHETSNRLLRTEQSFVSRKFHERKSRDKTKRCNISGKKTYGHIAAFFRDLGSHHRDRFYAKAFFHLCDSRLSEKKKPENCEVAVVNQLYTAALSSGWI